jgi:hypothetical protein
MKRSEGRLSEEVKVKERMIGARKEKRKTSEKDRLKGRVQLKDGIGCKKKKRRPKNGRVSPFKDTADRLE